jgi:hypothetical protein
MHVLKSGALAHEFTTEDRRRGGLARAARLRAQREQAARAVRLERLAAVFATALPKLDDEELEDCERFFWRASLRPPLQTQKR